MTDVKVGIIMGSQSDWPTMKEAAGILDELGIAYETKIVSAHRTPDRLWDYGKTAADRGGLHVIIAGAGGGAAHLPGMMASKTRVPWWACRCRPARCPVSTALFHRADAQGLSGRDMAIGGAAGAANAGLMAAGILAVSDAALADRLDAWREALSASIPDEPSDD